MIYIMIEEHPGILSGLYRCLFNAKYKLISNNFGKKEIEGKSYLEVEIEKSQLPLPPHLKDEILKIEGCLEIFYNDPAQKDNTSNSSPGDISKSTVDPQEIKKTCQEIVNNFQDIGNIVYSFSQRHQGSNNGNDIYSLGFSVGTAIYEVEYSLGKPLKLELALKRMLVDAIKSFGVVSCNQHLVSIEENIFCNTTSPNGQCHFTQGFVTGFLHSSPKTKDVKVENISCRSQGRTSCVFEFH